MNNRFFLECKSFREQVQFVYLQLSPKGIRAADIAKFFYDELGNGEYKMVERTVVKRHTDRITELAKGNGRPPELTKEQLDGVVEMIKTLHDSNVYLTFEQLNQKISDLYGKDVLMDTLRHIILRNPELSTNRIIPMEEGRNDLLLHLDDLAHYFYDLAESVNGVPSGLLLNCDEMGYSAQADTKAKTCVVPSEQKDKILYGSFNRSGRHFTLMCCVDLNGKCLKPMVATKQKTFEEELVKMGYGEDTILISECAKGYFTKVLFEQWVEEILIPEVQERRRKFMYDGPAYLILDGCYAHNTQRVNNLIQQNNITFKFLVPHSSHLAQPLDVGVFSILKRCMNNLSVPAHLSEQSKVLIKMYDGLQKVATPRNVISAFKGAGIDSILVSGKSYACVNPKELAMIEYSEVFAADYFPLIYGDDLRKQVKIGSYPNNLMLTKLHFDYAPLAHWNKLLLEERKAISKRYEEERKEEMKRFELEEKNRRSLEERRNREIRERELREANARLQLPDYQLRQELREIEEVRYFENEFNQEQLFHQPFYPRQEIFPPRLPQDQRQVFDRRPPNPFSQNPFNF